MSIPAAYIGVILIWSTTPLAVKWSGDGPGYLFGLTSRMMLGAVLCLILLRAFKIPFPWHEEARRVYLAAAAGIYGAMLGTYWAAQYLPSGWVSVVWGLSPMVTGVMAALWLGECSLTLFKLAGMALGTAGLAVIFHASTVLPAASLAGVAVLVLAVAIQSASAVGIKHYNSDLPALAVTGGSLVLSLPMYLLTWLALDGSWPATLPLRAELSIAYLAVFGSVLGFFLYFYLIKHLDASRTALITLVTPVLALFIGHALNGEALSFSIALGSGGVVLGLMLHQWGDRWYARAQGAKNHG